MCRDPHPGKRRHLVTQLATKHNWQLQLVTHPGDVVLDEEGVDVGRVVVRLNPEGLLERMEVLVPDHLGLGHSVDLALHLAAIHTDQVDVAGWPNELGVLSQHHDDLLSGLAVLVLAEALVGADVGGGEGIDLRKERV